MRHVTLLLASLSFLFSFSCGKSDSEFERETAVKVKELFLSDITALKQSSMALQARAPSTVWKDEDIAAMKAEWKKGRTAYEQSEGAIAPLFPNIDAAIDERYDGFLEHGADNNLFDDMGVTGMHAVERILFADVTPASVIAAESSITGYKAAAFPANDEEALAFKNKLLAKLVADTTTLETQWKSAELDLAGAYQGLVDLMLEQREKINNASAGFEESRYSQVTMSDLRNNYEGTVKVWAVFKPWLTTKKDGSALISQVATSFDELSKAYQKVQGEAIPTPPATWSAEEENTPADLNTDFGKLFTAVREATDESKAGSIVHGMNSAGVKFGFIVQ